MICKLRALITCFQTFVNVVKYKLDHIRKRMETQERDATSRASFKCPTCKRSFTDLEADQLYDPIADEFRCYMCHSVVEEDHSALPRTDSRQLMARFNEQMEPFYHLLREVEDVKLDPSLLEPEPTDISHLQRYYWENNVQVMHQFQISMLLGMRMGDPESNPVESSNGLEKLLEVAVYGLKKPELTSPLGTMLQYKQKLEKNNLSGWWRVQLLVELRMKQSLKMLYQELHRWNRFVAFLSSVYS